MTTYIISNTNSSLESADAGDDFSKALVRDGATIGTQVVTIAAGATETSYAYSRYGQPGINGADGDFEVGIYLYNDASPNIVLSITIGRVASDGTEYDVSSPTLGQVLDSEDVVYVFNVNTAFTEWNSGDRFRVGFHFTNNDLVSPDSVELGFGEIAKSYVETPWDLNNQWRRRGASID